MLNRNELLPPSAIHAFGASHNAAVWEKHRLFLASAGSSSGPAVKTLDAFRSLCGSKLTRKHVFDIAAADTAAGVAAAIIWGFPKGGLRGRWQPFAEAFRQADRYAEVIEHLRRAGPQTPACKALARLNAVQPGIGFATTSKIAYFSRLALSEGGALIYDSNVILAIKHNLGSEFSRTRAALGTGSTFYHRGTLSYGNFIAETEALSRAWCVAPEQIEAELFRLRANPRSGWN
jgi:hypothetical protein